MEPGIIEIFDAMRKAKSASIRYNGVKYYDKHKIITQELTDSKTMIEIFDLFER